MDDTRELEAMKVQLTRMLGVVSKMLQGRQEKTAGLGTPAARKGKKKPLSAETVEIKLGRREERRMKTG